MASFWNSSASRSGYRIYSCSLAQVRGSRARQSRRAIRTMRREFGQTQRCSSPTESRYAVELPRTGSSSSPPIRPAITARRTRAGGRLFIQDGTFVYVNQKLADIFSYDRATSTTLPRTRALTGDGDRRVRPLVSNNYLDCSVINTLSVDVRTAVKPAVKSSADPSSTMANRRGSVCFETLKPTPILASESPFDCCVLLAGSYGFAGYFSATR